MSKVILIVMKKTITYNKEDEVFTVELVIPRSQTGEYTYGSGEWKQDAVCVWIDKKGYEFTLSHAMYLDYKDSLQATQPIFSFDSEQEAITFAKEYSLMVEYAH